MIALRTYFCRAVGMAHQRAMTAPVAHGFLLDRLSVLFLAGAVGRLSPDSRSFQERIVACGFGVFLCVGCTTIRFCYPGYDHRGFFPGDAYGPYGGFSAPEIVAYALCAVERGLARVLQVHEFFH